MLVTTAAVVAVPTAPASRPACKPNQHPTVETINPKITALHSLPIRSFNATKLCN